MFLIDVISSSNNDVIKIIFLLIFISSIKNNSIKKNKKAFKNINLPNPKAVKKLIYFPIYMKDEGLKHRPKY